MGRSKRSSSSSSGSSSSSSESKEARRKDRAKSKSPRRSRSVSGEQQKDKDAKSRSQDAAAQSPPRDEAPAADDPAKLARQDKQAQIEELLKARGAGQYLPPHKLRMLEEAVTDKASVEYQRLTWDALKKSINGLINKANTSNLQNCVLDLFNENLVRGRGLLAQSLTRAQVAAPEYTAVYGALIAIINTKLPENGELIVKRVIISFRRSFKRNDKVACVALMKFIAHLVNQQVCHEILVLQVLTLLLEKPTDDSVEISISLIKECGATLSDISPQGLHAIFERLRAILHEGEIDKRVQYMVEGLFAVRKTAFVDFPALPEGLDLVDEDDQITHEISLDDMSIKEDKILNVFKPNSDYIEDEDKYKQIKKQILGAESDSEESGDDVSGEGSESDSESEEEEEGQPEAAGGAMDIQDESDVNVTTLRRVIYLTIMSSLSHEECAHKLMKVQIPPGYEHEVCNMMIECCAQERTYLRFYGLLAERFCSINPVFQEKFDEAFYSQYSTIHRLETNKLRNTAKLFSHLIHTDSISWSCMSYITLSQEDTTSSSRIFIKILFQDLCEHLGLAKMNERMHDNFMATHFTGLFPRDNPRNTRFAINFFTSIGLGFDGDAERTPQECAKDDHATAARRRLGFRLRFIIIV